MIPLNQNQILISSILAVYLGGVSRMNEVVLGTSHKQCRYEAVVYSFNWADVLDAEPSFLFYRTANEAHRYANHKPRHLEVKEDAEERDLTHCTKYVPLYVL